MRRWPCTEGEEAGEEEEGEEEGGVEAEDTCVPCALFLLPLLDCADLLCIFLWLVREEEVEGATEEEE